MKSVVGGQLPVVSKGPDLSLVIGVGLVPGVWVRDIQFSCQFLVLAFLVFVL